MAMTDYRQMTDAGTLRKQPQGWSGGVQPPAYANVETEARKRNARWEQEQQKGMRIESDAWMNAAVPGAEQAQEHLAAVKRWQNMETHHMNEIMTPGINAPAFIQTNTSVRSMQGALGIREDGVWGPETERAFRARLAQEAADAVAEIRRIYASQRNEEQEDRLMEAINAAKGRKAEAYGMQRETDVETKTTWEKKPIGALYSTMPRVIPEAAGVLARSMNTPEGISRVYDRAIAEKEAEWRGFDIRGANPRSPEGRALILERAQLYTAWKETEREKARAIAGWYRRRNEAAWAKSPDALIDVAVEDAGNLVKKHGYEKQSYPNNAVIEGKSMMFGKEEEMFTYSGSVLNYLTDYSGLEHMCGIYSVNHGDGRIEYISGPVVSGMQFGNIANVIIPFAACFISAEAYTTNVKKIYEGANVRFEGILHSHPSYGNGSTYNNNDNFSWGDGLAAKLSGKIWLTTQDGTMYALDGTDTEDVISAGLIWDILVGLKKIASSKIVDDYWKATYATLEALSEASRFETLNVTAYDASENRRQAWSRTK